MKQRIHDASPVTKKLVKYVNIYLNYWDQHRNNFNWMEEWSTHGYQPCRTQIGKYTDRN